MDIDKNYKAMTKYDFSKLMEHMNEHYKKVYKYHISNN